VWLLTGFSGFGLPGVGDKPIGEDFFGQIACGKGKKFLVSIFAGGGHVKTVENEKRSTNDVGGSLVPINKSMVFGNAKGVCRR
jgi:hypothetical protein